MRTINAVGTAIGARTRNPAPVGGVGPRTKANVLACDQALPGSTRRFTLHRGDPAATAKASHVPRCVAIRQIWCHVCAHGAKLPRNLASSPRGPSPPPGPAKLAIPREGRARQLAVPAKLKSRRAGRPGQAQVPWTSRSPGRSSPAKPVPAKLKSRRARCPRKSKRRPWPGAPPRSTSFLATKRAPSLSVRLTVPFLAASPGLTRLPRLVARGYLAAVPGRSDVRTTVLTRNPEPEKTRT
jgi:hypothetical protein